MKRMITKQMRDSFNLSFNCKLNMWCNKPVGNRDVTPTKKQRILILRRTVK